MAEREQIVARLAELFVETGQAHHRAFIETDGADPNWPLWYGEYLAPRLPELTGAELTQSAIVEFVREAESEHQARDPDAAWPAFYAKLFVDRFVAAEGETLALYHLSTCPFCLRVRRVIDRLGVDIELRDIMENPRYREELIAARGRATVPVLRCTADGKDRWMPESRDIIAYLEKRFG